MYTYRHTKYINKVSFTRENVLKHCKHDYDITFFIGVNVCNEIITVYMKTNCKTKFMKPHLILW